MGSSVSLDCGRGPRGEQLGRSGAQRGSPCPALARGQRLSAAWELGGDGTVLTQLGAAQLPPPRGPPAPSLSPHRLGAGVLAGDVEGDEVLAGDDVGDAVAIVSDLGGQRGGSERGWGAQGLLVPPGGVPIPLPVAERR